MLKNIAALPIFRKQGLKSLQYSTPLFHFSNGKASSIPTGEAPASTSSKPREKSQESASDSSKSNNLYYPVKRINFSKRDFFPIYTIDKQKLKTLSSTAQFFTSYGLFFSYGISYIFFFDIYNYWHLIPLTAFLLKGAHNLVKNARLTGAVIQSVFLKKDGKTLILTLPKTPAFRHYNEDIDLSPYDAYKNDIKLTVNLDTIYRVGFMEELEIKANNAEDFVPLKAKKKVNAEEEMKEASVESGELKDPDEVETNNIMFMIDKGKEILPLHLSLEANSSKAYDDYLIAIAQNKKIVLRETKDES